MSDKNINKKVLATKIHLNVGFSQIISENIVKDIFYIIESAMKNYDKIKITSFGTFFKKRKKKQNWSQSQVFREKNYLRKKCSYI